MQIGLEPAGIRFRLEAQRMVRPAGHPVVDIGAEMQHAAALAVLDPHFHRQERGIVDGDADTSRPA